MAFAVIANLQTRNRVASPINRGDSGGPVVNDRGELVALVESIYLSEPHNEVHLLSTFIDITEIKSFLKRHTEGANRGQPFLDGR